MIAHVSQFFARVGNKQPLALFNGKPVSGANTQALRSFDPANACGKVRAEKPAVRSLICESSNGSELQVDGRRRVPCSRQKFYDSAARTYGAEHLYLVSTILGSGLVAKNSCSKMTAAAKPGELVIFVRHSTSWERFIWGMKS